MQIQLLRILAVSDLFSAKRKRSVKRTFVYASIVTVAVTSGLGVLYAALSQLLIKSSVSPLPQMPYTLKDMDSSPDVNITSFQEDFMELTMHHIILESSKNVIRYSVSIEAEQKVPLYDCNFDYTLVKNNMAYFEIPDYPSGQIEIMYSCDSGLATLLTIDSFILSEDGRELTHQSARITSGGSI